MEIQSNILLFLLSILRRRILLSSRPAALRLEHCGKTARPAGTVILIHGLGRTGLSMLVPGFFLRRNGYSVFVYDYISGRSSVPQHAARLSDFIRDVRQTRPGRINFITHSLGGIVLRHAAADSADSFPEGRTVMIAPPNRGSKKATLFSKFPFLPLILKPLREIRGDEGSLAVSLPAPQFEHGVIAAEFDAKVSLDEAGTDSMGDFLVVESFHTFVMNRRDVLAACAEFLRQGKFRVGAVQSPK